MGTKILNQTKLRNLTLIAIVIATVSLPACGRKKHDPLNPEVKAENVTKPAEEAKVEERKALPLVAGATTVLEVTQAVFNEYFKLLQGSYNLVKDTDSKTVLGDSADTLKLLKTIQKFIADYNRFSDEAAIGFLITDSKDKAVRDHLTGNELLEKCKTKDLELKSLISNAIKNTLSPEDLDKFYKEMLLSQESAGKSLGILSIDDSNSAFSVRNCVDADKCENGANAILSLKIDSIEAAILKARKDSSTDSKILDTETKIVSIIQQLSVLKSDSDIISRLSTNADAQYPAKIVSAEKGEQALLNYLKDKILSSPTLISDMKEGFLKGILISDVQIVDNKTQENLTTADSEALSKIKEDSAIVRLVVADLSKPYKFNQIDLDNANVRLGVLNGLKTKDLSEASEIRTAIELENNLIANLTRLKPEVTDKIEEKSDTSVTKDLLSAGDREELNGYIKETYYEDGLKNAIGRSFKQVEINNFKTYIGNDLDTLKKMLSTLKSDAAEVSEVQAQIVRYEAFNVIIGKLVADQTITEDMIK